MKEYIRKIVYLLFSLLNCVIPKKNKVFIYGGTDLSGNSEAMLNYLVNNTELQITCIAESKADKYNNLKHVTYKKNSIYNAFIACATSKVVLDSSLHTVKMVPRKNQLFIQMWHGSPLKHLPANGLIKNAKYYTKIFYSAEIFREEIRQSFKAEERQMLLAGNPRNDNLFADVNLPDAFRHDGRTVIWLPTFRRGIGIRESSKDLPIITNNNIAALDNHLRMSNMMLYIKPHPLQEGGLNDLVNGLCSEHIKVIKDEDLRHNNISLYSFLGAMDALITDYSSVFFDYLLLDRPIGFAIDDIDEYQKNRGFALEPVEDYMPGMKISTMSELIQFLQNVNCEIDEYKSERARINKTVNTFNDDKNCERCASLIIGNLKGKRH